MTAAPHILARTLKEAHDFAQSRGFARGHYRVVNSAGSIKSVRNVDLYLVPGWERRYDRFAMKSALRWTRMNVIDVATLKEPAPVDPNVPGSPVGDATDFFELPDDVDHPVDQPGGSFEDFDTVANYPTDFFSAAPDTNPLEDLENAKELIESLDAVPDDLQPPGEQVALFIPGGGEVPQPEPKTKRRRSRCKECGNLHYKGEPCPPNESV